MEIIKVNVPVKALSTRCLQCPSMEIVSNELNYGKEAKQYIFECKHLKHCLFMAKMIEEEVNSREKHA
jgi:hypothetical protein